MTAHTGPTMVLEKVVFIMMTNMEANLCAYFNVFATHPPTLVFWRSWELGQAPWEVSALSLLAFATTHPYESQKIDL